MCDFYRLTTIIINYQMWPLIPHLTLHGGHQARAAAEHTVLASHLMVKCDNI